MKKFSAALLVVCLWAWAALPAFGATTAAQLNKAYWPLQESYVKALDSKNNAEIFNYGQKIYALLGEGKDASTFLKNGDSMEINILFGTLYQTAKAAEATGNLSEAARFYSLTLPYVDAYTEINSVADKSDYEFMKTEIRNKITLYSPKIELYAQVPAGENPRHYTGGKFEPKAGLYYGVANSMDSSGASQNKLVAANQKNDSSVIIYVDFKNESMEKYAKVFDAYKNSSSIIQVAWNLPNEGDGLAAVLNEGAYITESARYLKSMGANILLRFGAEMNVWERKADPDKFIQAFRFVADTVRKEAPNVAMVFSPNDVSAVGLNYEMFYPGDQYVDWVGVSAYINRNFRGKAETDQVTQSIYLVGDYANPIAQLEAIVNTYGDRKPIMISEMGAENFNTASGQDFTQWAKVQMERAYYYIPMVYPQIKAIYYFDKKFGVNQYSLFTNETLNRLYLSLTDNPVYIPANGNAGVEYKQLKPETVLPAKLKLSTYFVQAKQLEVEALYKLDGKETVRVKSLPYTYEADFSALSNGEHSLSVELFSTDGKKLGEKTVKLTKQGSEIKVVQ